MAAHGFFRRNIARLRWAVTPPAKKKAAMAEIKDILRQWPDTAALLQLAEEKGIPVFFDAGLIGKRTAGVFTRSTVPGRTRIGLQPLRPPEQAAATLVHELRHLWQAETLDLGAADLRGEYASPRRKILVTRVKEADAYAFTHMIAMRIRRMGDDLAEAAGMAKNLAAQNPGSSLTRDQIAHINRHFREKVKSYPEDDTRCIRERFLQELEDLDSYDRSSLRKYHALYTTPHFTPKAKPPNDNSAFALSGLRRILRAGVAADAPDYMAGISDFALARHVLRPVQADVKKVASLMTAFEKAAARGRLDDKESLARRRDIARHVKEVNAATRKKRLEKPALK